MAILLPFILRYKNEPDKSGKFTSTSFPLLVNPTDITVRKRAQIAEMRTLAGTIFQPWPNMPDEVSIKGLLYGSRSVLDFRTLQNIIDKRPDLKEVELIYKWKTYKGYVRDIVISASADKPRMFNYEFNFVSKEPFSLPRMMLGQLTGYRVELDYLREQLYGLKNSIKSDPITGIANVVSTATVVTVDNFSEIQKLLNKLK